MCGLFGVIGYAGHDSALSSVVSTLMKLSEFRGKDSTGLCGINHHKREYTLLKKAWPANAFVDWPPAQTVVNNVNSYAMLLGHTRAATRGKVCHANAHPFVVEDRLVLTHNGYVNGWDSKQYGVDSEWLAHQVLEKGLDLFSTLSGEYAVAWYSFDTNRAYLVRNTKRPLFVAAILVGGSTKLVYASELGMLQFALGRESIPVQDYYELSPHVIYEFDPANARLLSAREFTPPKEVVSSYGNWENWSDGCGVGGKAGSGRSSYTPPVKGKIVDGVLSSDAWTANLLELETLDDCPLPADGCFTVVPRNIVTASVFDTLCASVYFCAHDDDPWMKTNPAGLKTATTHMSANLIRGSRQERVCQWSAATNSPIVVKAIGAGAVHKQWTQRFTTWLYVKVVNVDSYVEQVTAWEESAKKSPQTASA